MRRNRPLLLVHLVGNALLLWLAYEWLGVDESTTGKLLLSAVDAVAIVALACWLWGAALVWFQAKAPTLNESFRTALRHVGGLLLLAIAALVLYGLTGKLADSTAPLALKIASWLTWTIRKPVKPATIGAIFTAVFWICRWALFPVLLLPVGAGIAARGREGWRAFRLRQPWRRWLVVPLLALAGIRLPMIILNWSPKSTSFGIELTSFVLRAVLAYALFLAALLTLARVSAQTK